MKIIYASDYGGLCNNIKCYLSASRLALEENAEVWTNSNILNSIYSNIKFIEHINQCSRVVKDWRFIVLDKDDVPENFSQSKDSMRFPGVDKLRRNIDFEYERIPKKISDTYLCILNGMEIRADLLSIVNDFSEKYFNHDVCSVHMRTWVADNWQNSVERHNHYFSYDKYVDAINKLNSQSKVFLSSDNVHFTRMLQDEFGSKLIIFDEFQSLNLNELERAFVNLLLLSKNKKLIGSRVSTFTEMAWWYSGCSSKVLLL